MTVSETAEHLGMEQPPQEPGGYRRTKPPRLSTVVAFLLLMGLCAAIAHFSSLPFARILGGATFWIILIAIVDGFRRWRGRRRVNWAIAFVIVGLLVGAVYSRQIWANADAHRLVADIRGLSREEALQHILKSKTEIGRALATLAEVAEEYGDRIAAHLPVFDREQTEELMSTTEVDKLRAVDTDLKAQKGKVAVFAANFDNEVAKARVTLSTRTSGFSTELRREIAAAFEEQVKALRPLFVREAALLGDAIDVYIDAVAITIRLAEGGDTAGSTVQFDALTERYAAISSKLRDVVSEFEQAAKGDESRWRAFSEKF